MSENPIDRASSSGHLGRLPAAFVDFSPPSAALPPPTRPPTPMPPPEPPGRRPWGAIAALMAILVVVVALITWLAVRGTGPGSSPSSDSQPSPIPSETATASLDPAQSGWRGPLQLVDSRPMPGTLDIHQIDFVADSMAIVNDDHSISGIDLANLRYSWTVDIDFTWPVLGDSTGVAVIAGTDIDVYDVQTGQVIGQAPLTPRSTTPGGSTPSSSAPTALPSVLPSVLPSDGGSPSSAFTDPTAPPEPPTTWESLLWAGDGLLLMSNAFDGTICVRKMTNPGTCVWSAKNMWTSAADYVGTSVYLIGRDLWVNTAEGVRDLATGQPAPFGADAGSTPAGPVYYAGPPTRIFRLTSPDELQRTGPGTAQPWDVGTDTALAPAVPADVVDADPSSSVFVSIVNHAEDANTVTAYSWASGQQLWQRDNLFEWNVLVGLSGGVYLGQTMDRTMLMLDATTSEEVTRAGGLPSPDPSTAVSDGHVYVATDSLNVYDDTTGEVLWSTALPDQLTGNVGWFFATTTYVGFISATNAFWVLDV